MQFSFQYFFPSMDVDFQSISLDFTIDFAIFTIWLHMYGWTDKWTEKWTDAQIARRTDQLMDGHAIYVHRDAKNNDLSMDFAIFTKALRTDGRTYPLIEMR